MLYFFNSIYCFWSFLRVFLLQFLAEPEELTSFLTKLSSCDQDEIEAKLADRLAFSKKAVNRLTEMFCKLKEDQEKANLDWKDKGENNTNNN